MNQTGGHLRPQLKPRTLWDMWIAILVIGFERKIYWKSYINFSLLHICKHRLREMILMRSSAKTPSCTLHSQVRILFLTDSVSLSSLFHHLISHIIWESTRLCQLRPSDQTFVFIFIIFDFSLSQVSIENEQERKFLPYFYKQILL